MSIIIGFLLGGALLGLIPLNREHIFRNELDLRAAVTKLWSSFALHCTRILKRSAAKIR